MPHKLICGLLFLLCVSCSGNNDSPERENRRSQYIPKRSEVLAAITKGERFLVTHQNKDGSWGSSRFAGGVFLYAPIPGAHQGFKAAVTSLSLMALLESGDLTKADVVRSIDMAENFLLKNLKGVRRAEGSTIYNVWTHAYSIRALSRLLKYRKSDKEKVSRFKELMSHQVNMLKNYECMGGGWGYYSDLRGREVFRRPHGHTTSFTTATVMIALKEAEKDGVKVYAPMVKRGLLTLKHQQNPNFTYVYSGGHTRAPVYDINRLGGSLARSQVCNLALRKWGDKKITDDVLREWVAHLVIRNDWLEMGRKKPVPHESFLAVAGYFYYYGHYYAASCLEELPDDMRREFHKPLARLIYHKQEKDGSWWDYPMYSYHKFYGTPMAMMTLKKCLQQYDNPQPKEKAAVKKES